MESFNFERYENKMYDYETVYDAVIEEFNNDIFGLFSNTVSSDKFQECLLSDGWKYFDLKNLNEFFDLKYKECVKKGLIQDLAKIEEPQSDNDDSILKQDME